MSKLIHDWKAYNESLIFTISDDDHRESGLDIFDFEKKKKKEDVVPNEITSCYPHAVFVADLIKNILDQSSFSPENKFTILEIGAGLGTFSANLLRALQENQEIERVKLILTEYDQIKLQAIQENETMKDFEQGEDYELAQLDMLNLDNAKYLDGTKLDLSQVNFTILNYALSCLPITILKKDNKKYQEFNLRFKENESKEKVLAAGKDYYESLEKKGKWLDYKIKDQGELEQKYFKFAENRLKKNPTEPLYYNYASLSLIDELINRCAENSSIYISEMPTFNNGIFPSYAKYGNCFYHSLNDGLVSQVVEEKQGESLRLLDHSHKQIRMLIFKDKELTNSHSQSFNEKLIKSNNINRYLDLYSLINNFDSKSIWNEFGFITEELVQINPYSTLAQFHYSNYLESQGKDGQEAKNKSDQLNYNSSREFHLEDRTERKKLDDIFNYLPFNKIIKATRLGQDQLNFSTTEKEASLSFRKANFDLYVKATVPLETNAELEAAIEELDLYFDLKKILERYKGPYIADIYQKFLNRFLELDPSSNHSLEFVANLYEMVGREEEAKEMREKVVIARKP